MRFPAAECLYQTHYSERSVVSNIYHFLRTKVPLLRKGDNGVCVASGYMLKTLLWFRLEACGRVEDWDHRRVAEHVLSVLDALVAALKAQHHRSYFYPYANVVLNAPRACRTMVSEDDYQNDVEIVEAYMYGLFEKSMGSDSIVTGQAFQNPEHGRGLLAEPGVGHDAQVVPGAGHHGPEAPEVRILEETSGVHRRSVQGNVGHQALRERIIYHLL
jgi:hypothetical protein